MAKPSKVPAGFTLLPTAWDGCEAYENGDGRLWLALDTDGGRPSSSGKMRLTATTGGFQRVRSEKLPEGLKLSLNLGKDI